MVKNLLSPDPELRTVLVHVDALLVSAANRLGGYLQEQMGLTMPMILRQAATATIMATGLAVIATFLMRGPLYMVITLIFAAITISAFWRLLARYTRDAEKDWTSDLARDYMIRAIGAMEGQRRIREIGLIFAVISLMLSVSIAQFRSLDMVDLAMIALVVCTMGHMYLSCVEPKPPGTQRRSFKLALQGTR
jgi:hypothetical protein